MSIIQISKIQVRRGPENTGTGLPALDTGEFGWAIDTQNLYIGGGTVNEGAPEYNPHIKILTEKDSSSLIDTVLEYQYKKNDVSITAGAPRSIQDRLDDYVSVKAFNNIISDAVFQLFSTGANVDISKRVILEIPAGIYRISESLELTTFSAIRGAGSGKTVIIQEEAESAFSIIPNSSNILLSGITFIAEKPNTTIGVIQSAKHCVFNDIEFIGVWDPLDITGTTFTDNSSVGLQLLSTSDVVPCQHNQFINCSFNKLNTAVSDDADSIFNTWDSNLILECHTGLNFGEHYTGLLSGPTSNVIQNNKFIEIFTHGIIIYTGQYNLSTNNIFTRVGTDGGPEVEGKFSPIKFIDKNNLSINDNFDRSHSTLDSTSPHMPEISGYATYDNKFTNSIEISSDPSDTTPVNFLKFSANNNTSHSIHYMYISSANNFKRQGVISVATNSNTVNISDDYTTQGNALLDENTEFSAVFSDLDLDNINDTITLQIQNKNEFDSGTLIYWTQSISAPLI